MKPLLLGLCGIVGAGSFGGCDSSEPELALVAAPAHASMFGDVDLTLTGDLGGVGEVQAVDIRGVRALDLRAVPGGMKVRIQGAPESGPAEIVITGALATRTNKTAFAYDPPAGGVPVRWVAFGASLTHGSQSGGLDARGQRMGYAAQIARAAGVCLGLPLVTDGALPPLAPAAFKGNCEATQDIGNAINALFGVVAPAGQEVDLRRARKDPALRARNVAIGGATVRNVLEGSGGFGRVLERIEALPDGEPIGFESPDAHPQIDRVIAMDAEVGFSGDLLANDMMPAITGDDIDISKSTGPQVLAQDLDRLMDALGRLHGQYFIGTFFDATALPSIALLRARRISAKTDTAESFDAKLEQIRTRIQAYDRALAAAVARHPNLHLVALAAEVMSIIRDGVTIDGEHLTGARFGGLLSLDHMHFSETGYALFANVFVREINRVLAARIPEIDVAAVHREDPLSAAQLRAAGVSCTP